MFLNLREKIFGRTQENQKLLFSAGAPINISLTFMTNLQVLQFSKFRAFIKKKKMKENFQKNCEDLLLSCNPVIISARFTSLEPSAATALQC